MTEIASSIVASAIVFFLAAIIFLICRHLLCWYWRINERADNLKEILRLQKEQLDIQKKILEALETLSDHITFGDKN